mgnify:CR=1 FL=1
MIPSLCKHRKQTYYFLSHTLHKDDMNKHRSHLSFYIWNMAYNCIPSDTASYFDTLQVHRAVLRLPVCVDVTSLGIETPGIPVSQTELSIIIVNNTVTAYTSLI